MRIFLRTAAVCSASLAVVQAVPTFQPRDPVPFYTPYYGTSANNFTSPAPGWSVGCNGDANGVPTPDTSKFPSMTDLANYVHSKGMKLGIYVIPGAFSGDAQKTVHDKDLNDTGIQIGSLFNVSAGTPLCRGQFDPIKDGVQQWHDSTVATCFSWGVDMIKLDCITPGSPNNNADMPADNSGSVKAYHQAIINNNAAGKVRLDISWKLDRSDPYWGDWQSSADSQRLDQDINNSGDPTLVAWQTVLQTIEYYRQFINEQTQTSRQGQPIMIRPDMHNMYVGNLQSIGGLSDVQRYTMAMHWVGAGANLIVGSDETRRDELGCMLLTDGEVYGQDGIAAFTQQYPMQPRNPSGWGTVGGNAAMQAQASNGTAVVILSNYGPDPCYQQACATYNLNWGSNHLVSINLSDLGLGSISNMWNVYRVWGGGGQGGEDHSTCSITETVESWLGPGESVLYVLSKP